MAQKDETVFRAWFEKRLKKVPNSSFESIQQETIIGTPDKLGCVNSIFVALEFKKSTKATTAHLQKYKLEKFSNKARGIAIKVYPENGKEILTFLNELGRLEWKRPKQLSSLMHKLMTQI